MWSVTLKKYNKQVFIFVLRNTHTHTREMERDSNTKAHHNSTQKSWRMNDFRDIINFIMKLTKMYH